MAVSAPAPAHSVDEYLSSTYRPDCEYIDGTLLERSVGEFEHSRLQILLGHWFVNHEAEWGILALTEQRVQVLPTRFRVPDLTVMRQEQTVDRIVLEPPLICVEILSPDDSVHEMRERAADYQRMGVPHVWLIDPVAREALVCTPTGWNEPPDGRLSVPGTEIHIPLDEFFAMLPARVDLDE